MTFSNIQEYLKRTLFGNMEQLYKINFQLCLYFIMVRNSDVTIARRFFIYFFFFVANDFISVVALGNSKQQFFSMKTLFHTLLTAKFVASLSHKTLLTIQN